MDNNKISPAMRPIVLYDVSMLFLSAEQVNILILEHKEAACIEVIAYSPTLDVEAPRIYLDFNILNAKISYNVKQKENINDGIKLPTTDGHLISYITSRLVIPDCTSKQKFVIRLTPNNDADVLADKDTNRLDFVFKTKPTVVIPFETYRSRSEFDSRSHKDCITNEKIAEQSVETFMNYHYDTICNSTAISAFAAILRGQDGKMVSDDGSHMNHVRLNNSELYKKADISVTTDSATPVNHVKHIKDTLRRAPALHHILEVEQHTLLEAASSDTEHRNEEKKLHRLATECVKTYRKSFLNSTINTTVVFATDKNKGQRAPSVIDEAKLQWLKIFWDSVDLHDDSLANGSNSTPTMSGLVNNNKTPPVVIDPDVPTSATPGSTSLTLAGSRRSSLSSNTALTDSPMESNMLVTTAQNITFVHRSSMAIASPASPVGIASSLSADIVTTTSSDSAAQSPLSLGVKSGGSMMSSLPPLGMSPAKNKLPSLFHSESEVVLPLGSTAPLSGRPTSRRDVVTPGLGDTQPVDHLAQTVTASLSITSPSSLSSLDPVNQLRRVRNPINTKTSPEHASIRTGQQEPSPSRNRVVENHNHSPSTSSSSAATVSSSYAHHMDNLVTSTELYGIRTEELMHLPLIKGANAEVNNSSSHSINNSSVSNSRNSSRSGTRSKGGSPLRGSTQHQQQQEHKSPYLSAIDPSDLLPNRRDTNRKNATHVHTTTRGPTPTHVVASRGPSCSSSPYNSAPNSRSVSVVNSVANSPMSTPRRAGAMGDDHFSTLSMDILTYEYTALSPPRTPLGSVNVNGMSGFNSSSGSGKGSGCGSGGIASPKRNVLMLGVPQLSEENEKEDEEVYVDDYEE